MITDLQSLALRTFVEGRVVHDLGSGDLRHAMALLELGAKAVVAVDVLYREDRDARFIACVGASVAAQHGHRLDVRAESFADLLRKVEAGAEALDVAFASWPLNRRMPELVELCRRSRVVCYLGSCTDGNACGHEDLFEHFITRELLSEVPDRANTLLVLGRELGGFRMPVAEEFAGLRLNDGSGVITYEESRAVVGKVGA